jgi:hypothetical protein
VRIVVAVRRNVEQGYKEAAVGPVDDLGLDGSGRPHRCDRDDDRPFETLNPQENIWQFMRDNWLSNRVFKSFDDIVDHCCDAWNKLVDQPWKIMSIGLQVWANEF